MLRLTAVRRQFESDAHGWPLLGFLAIVLLLFHRLALGEVLHPGANKFDWPPFWKAGHSEHLSYANGIQGDVWRHTIAFEQLQYESAKAGRIAQWNPSIYAGFGACNNGQFSPFFPFHWPYFFVDPVSGRGPIAALRLLTTLVAFYFLARRFGMNSLPAFVAACAWGLSAVNIRWLQWTLSNATLLLPLLLLALDCYLARPTPRRFAVAALVAGVFQLSGQPEMQFLVAIIAGVLALARLLSLGITWREIVRRVLGCFAIMIAGTAVAAIALWPFTLQLVESYDWRHKLHSAKVVPPLKTLVMMLAPDWFGRPRAGYSYDGPINYNEMGCWLGLAPLALALATATWSLSRSGSSEERRLKILVRACAGIALVVLASVYGVEPFSSAFLALPILGQCNHHRLLFAVQFVGSVSAGAGFQLLMNQPGRSWRTFVLALIAAATILLGWKAASDGRRLADLLAHTHDWRIALNDPWLRNMVAFAFALSATMVVAVIAGKRTSNARGPRILAAVILLELLWVAWDFNPTTPVRLADPPAPPLLARVIAAAGDGRIAATDEILAPNLAMRYGFRDARGYDFPLPERLGPVLRDLELPLSPTLIPKARAFPQWDPRLANFLDRMAVRFLFTDQRQDEIAVMAWSAPVMARSSSVPSARPQVSNTAPWQLIEAPPGIDAVYENPNAYPRSWIAIRFEIVDADTARRHLLDPGADLRETSFVESAGADLTSAIDQAAEAEGQVATSDINPEHVAIDVDSPTGGLVVLADRLEPGWSVAVDGVAAAPLQTNYLFRGVLVPPGRHRIDWTYATPGRLAGTIVSAVAAAGVLIVFASGKRSAPRAADDGAP